MSIYAYWPRIFITLAGVFTFFSIMADDKVVEDPFDPKYNPKAISAREKIVSLKNNLFSLEVDFQEGFDESKVSVFDVESKSIFFEGYITTVEDIGLAKTLLYITDAPKLTILANIDGLKGEIELDLGEIHYLGISKVGGKLRFDPSKNMFCYD